MSYRTVKVKRVVRLAQREDVFDLEVPTTHNFVANGIVIHNCRYGAFFKMRDAGLLPDIITEKTKKQGWT